MLYTTRAIVLRTVKYGETSLIADMYTEQKGHQTFIINSVRKAKASTPPSYLQLMSLVEMVAYFHEQRKVHRIKEVRLEHVYASIPFDMRKSAVVTCIGEMCSKCIMTADPHPELFQYIHDQLVDYDHPDEYDPDLLIRFLVGLTHYLGFGMDLEMQEKKSRYFDLQEGHFVSTLPRHPYLMSMEDSEAIYDIVHSDTTTKSKISTDTRRRMVDQLITYYQLHVESLREVNSIRVLRELL